MYNAPEKSAVPEEVQRFLDAVLEVTPELHEWRASPNYIWILMGLRCELTDGVEGNYICYVLEGALERLEAKGITFTQPEWETIKGFILSDMGRLSNRKAQQIGPVLWR